MRLMDSTTYTQRPARSAAFVLVFALMTLSAECTARAHFIWVVPVKDRIEVHFGETATTGDPELLANIASAKAWTRTEGRDGAQFAELSLRRGDDSLTAARESADAIPIVSHEFGVVTRGGTSFLLRYHAKGLVDTLPVSWKIVGDAERLPLEIVPSWDGVRLRLAVVWRGQPAPRTQVVVQGGGLDAWEGTTDEAGLVWCEPTASGLLSIRARRVAEERGERDGKAYTEARDYATLTLPIDRPTMVSVEHSLPPLPQGITSFGAALADNRLYVYGGHFGRAHHYSQEGQSNQLLRLELTQRPAEQPAQWEPLATGPKLTGLALVEHAGRLYRVGGFTAKNTDDQEQDLWSQDSFALFDPAAGEWRDLPPLPEPRSSHDAAVLDGQLYVVGGWRLSGGETTWHSTAWRCDLTRAEVSWEQVPDPPFHRRALSVAAHAGRLYVMGGMQESGGVTTRVARYDPATKSWDEAPPLHGSGLEGFGTSAFSRAGELLVTTISGSVQRLAADGTSWQVVGALRSPRFFHRQLTTPDGRTLIVGGASMESGKTLELELLAPRE